MSSKLCPFCMRMTEGDTCPHCGKSINYAGSPTHLPAGYVVSGAHPYVIGAALGQGGFGITYIALDMVTNERVAIKEYFPTFCASRTDGTVSAYPNQEETFQKGRERFLDEARVLKSLSDLKCIVNVLDFFEFNNSAYLVMEFLEGSSLKDYAAKNGKFPAQKFLSQIRPLMEDIERMHQRGVVHRDIAPDNIMLLPDGQMKLIDFGTARSFIGDRSMTVVVKKGFAPLEQYLTKGTTPSTDVYALAATIYYCITGTVPMDSAERQYDGTPLESPSALGADITPLQEKALAKALEIQQKARTQSVQEFLNDLNKEPEKPKPEPVKQKPSVAKPDFKEQEPLPRKKKPRWIAAAAAILAVVALVGFFTARSENEKASLEVNVQDTTASAQKITTAQEPPKISRSEEKWATNIMMSGRTSSYDNRAFGSDIPRDKVISVTFLDTIADAPESSWDFSYRKNRSVLAWAKEKGAFYEFVIAGEGGINGMFACQGMFDGFENLEKIEFNDCFHTEEVTDMSGMFQGCAKLTELDLRSFDTSNVLHMDFMFNHCNVLTTLDLRNFDTSKVIYMQAMFGSCENLTDVDVSGFNTSNVINMSGMFGGCSKLNDLVLSNFNFTKVEKYDGFMNSGVKVNGQPWEKLFEK